MSDDFAPTSPSFTLTPTIPLTQPAAPVLTQPTPVNLNSMDPLPQVVPASSSTTTQSATTVNPPGVVTNPDGTTSRNANISDVQNQSLLDVLANGTYDDNLLDAVNNPAYKFRLYLTSEHELVTSATSNQQYDDLLKTLDALPQIVIAESGVTAGFNIRDVEMEQTCGISYKSRSNVVTSFKIVITEPGGSSMMEAILNASMAMGIQNFAKTWYFLELSFTGYNEDGSYAYNPFSQTSGTVLPNGGRWVWVITINDMDVHMDEGGSTYTLSCVPFDMIAFDDNTCGRVPDAIQCSGSTIKEFLDDFCTKLQASWAKRYLGEIYKFSINIRDDNAAGSGQAWKNPGAFTLTQTDQDPTHGLSLQKGTNGGVTATIPADTSVNDVITFLYANCKQAQAIMIDVTDPENLTDQGDATGVNVTFNGKSYRVPILPVVEPLVIVFGYDPITGQYMKNITYNIWCYRTYNTNICTDQFANMVKNDGAVAGQLAKELMTKRYLRKRYEYRYTGLNTEVLRFDLNYNFAYAAQMPRLTGWKNTRDANTHQAKYNEKIKGDQPNEIAKSTGSTSLSNVQISQLSDQISSLQAKYNTANAIANGSVTVDPTTKQPYTKDAIAAQATNAQNIQNQLNGLTAQVQNARNDFNTRIDLAKHDLETNNANRRLYAEDEVTGQSSYQLTYVQSHTDDINSAQQGFIGPWHRGASLVGAIMNQMYEPITTSLTQIDLDIRGDPFWISYSNLERKSMLVGGLQHTTDSPVPNYPEGDATIVLTFKFAATLDTNGNPLIRSDDVFNGLYRVINVTSKFNSGAFTQTLKAIKLPLITTIKPNQVSGGLPPAGSLSSDTNTTPNS